jgi:outer membrane protein OmpA-like peptidoglycan-associated protein
LEGHAVMIYWDQPAKAKVEQEEVLLPLSQERARVIKDALVQRGVRADRMSTAGYGGLYPVVPHGDLDNRWKSRRVEFILIKQ